MQLLIPGILSLELIPEQTDLGLVVADNTRLGETLLLPGLAEYLLAI